MIKHFFLSSVVLLSVFILDVRSQDLKEQINHKTIELAASNIIREVLSPEVDRIIVVFSSEKKEFAKYIIKDLERERIEYSDICLQNTRTKSEKINILVEKHTNNFGYIFLISPIHAPLLFEAVGRPDFGLKLPEKNLYCDWLAKIETVIRTYGIDYSENAAFQASLYQRLKDSKKIQIITEAGTDVIIFPRYWKTIHGELFTAPVEEKTSGKIVIDACAYWGPPEVPVELYIEEGKVINLGSLDQNIKQQKWISKDLQTDKNSSIVCELGVGTNLGAKWDQELMESEQARGTCHFGFGMNIDFGGRIESAIHVDYVLRNPTIVVDGCVICENGVFFIDD